MVDEFFEEGRLAIEKHLASYDSRLLFIWRRPFGLILLYGKD